MPQKKPAHKKKPKLRQKPRVRRKPKPEGRRRTRHGQKPRKPLRKPHRPPRSGSIPRPCRKFLAQPRLLGEAKLLDCWLDQNPAIANAIVWEPATGSFVAWPDWSVSMKSALRQAWMDAREWQAGGMRHYGGTPWTDPPPNQDVAPDDPAWFRTVFDGPTQAWPWYVATVAQSLAAEIEAWVPWSLRGFGAEALAHLLSAPMMFRRDTGDGGPWDADHPGGYVLGGSMSMEICTPAHPTYTYKFLVGHDLVDATIVGTVGRVIDWCRWNLAHYMGSFTPQNAEYHWQYRGASPVRRIIEGTQITDPMLVSAFPDPMHWTRGCGGTTAFLRSVLRSVNIPVEAKYRGSHTMPYFHGAARYLSHGDDPYWAISKADYPAELLLVDPDTFDAWFPFDPNASAAQKEADYATSYAHVGQRPVDLAVWHLSDALIVHYCHDKSVGLSHADGDVFKVFSTFGYTVHELEVAELWQRLEAAAAAQGKC